MTFLAIARALDKAADEGRTVRFWWRDDDAVADTPALDRLLSLSGASCVPVTLAVIPAKAERSLADRLRDEHGVCVAVHGWTHANHAPAGAKSAEFGSHRPLRSMAAEARRGRVTLAKMFPAADVALFVPPWNRVASALVPMLLADGYAGVSCFGAAAATFPNTHVDPVDWRGSRGLLDPARIEAAFVRAAASGEAVGLLTHHLGFDEKLWAWCAEILAFVRRHRAVAAVSSGDLLSMHRSGSNLDEVRDLLAKPPLSAECRP